MADHAQLHWYSRFEGREIVIVRGLITLVVVVGAAWGADFTDIGERAENTLDAVAVFAALLGLGWQRAGVSPTKEVVAQAVAGGPAVAGPASPLPDGTEVDVYRHATTAI